MHLDMGIQLPTVSVIWFILPKQVKKKKRLTGDKCDDSGGLI